jgi:hypothetical protein
MWKLVATALPKVPATDVAVSPNGEVIFSGRFSFQVFTGLRPYGHQPRIGERKDHR